MIFNILYEKGSILHLLKQRLFQPCPKSNQFFLGSGRIECKKFEVPTMSRFWVIVSTNLFACFLACFLACLLTESVFCDFLGNGLTNFDSVFCKRCGIPSTTFCIANLFGYFAYFSRKLRKTNFSIWPNTIYSHVVHGVNMKKNIRKFLCKKPKYDSDFNSISKIEIFYCN